MSLSFEDLARLANVFVSNGWDLDCKFRHPTERLFDRMAGLLASLSVEQRELLFALLPEFIWIRDEQYPYFIRAALEKIPIERFHGIQQIFVVPITSDASRNKSGHTLVYPVAESILPTLVVSEGRTISRFQSIKDLPEEQDSSIVLIVDDFIGSGLSAKETIDLHKKHFSNSNAVLIFASIICLDEGRKLLSDMGFEAYAVHYPPKAISSGPAFKSCHARAEARATMMEIEDRLPVAKDYNFGFKRCEAQVALIRTPDNTFPVYWLDADAGSKTQWRAPFPR